MCVIAVIDTDRITEDMVAKMYDANDAGSGAAWRDGEGNVRWKKGLNLDEIQELAANLPIPYVLHFRIPTVGGRVKELTHPFPVTPDVSLELEGKTKGYVLFHNGHWGKWRDTVLDATVRMSGPNKGGRGLLPPGKWSDSRAMAWTAYHYGIGILEFIDEKAIAFGPKDVEVFCAPSWDKVNNVWVSNKGWDNRIHYNRANHNTGFMGGHVSNHEYSRVHGDHSQVPARIPANAGDDSKLPAHYQGKKGAAGGQTPAQTFCTGDGSSCEGEAVTQEVQEGQTRLRLVVEGGAGETGEKGQQEGPAERAPSVNEPRTEVLNSNSQMAAMKRWACSLNPKSRRVMSAAMTTMIDDDERALDLLRKRHGV